MAKMKINLYIEKFWQGESLRGLKIKGFKPLFV
jgi:hypothetical protein